MDNTLKLKKPIVHGSETITELIFSEPTAKEMRVLTSSPTLNEVLRIAAMLTNQTDRVMDKLSPSDTRRVAEKTAFLLADGD